MGKKSRRSRAGRSGGAASGNGAGDHVAAVAADRNVIPRQRILFPEDWDISVAGIHPFVRPEYAFMFLDDEKIVDKHNPDARPEKITHYAHCPMCLRDASQVCSRCGTVNYCSTDCQKAHWKLSHKQACKPNPKPFKMNLDLTQFQGLSDDCFEGHEFIIVKPSEKLSSLSEICQQVLEPADDLFDIPGFGVDQLNILWLSQNAQHLTYRRMIQRFGWTSGRLSLELVNGYRVAEAKIMYFVLCDDAFQSQTAMAPSYYGEALFGELPPGKHVRGNLVIYKCMLKNKMRQQNRQTPQFPSLLLNLSDDSDITYEFIIAPINKAEIAHLLSERKRAMEEGAYTPRMWRYPIRQTERRIEVEKLNAPGGPFTIAF